IFRPLYFPNPIGEAEQRGGRFDLLYQQGMRRISRLLEDCNPNGLRHDLLEQFEPLHGQFRGHDGEPGCVAPRVRQTCDQAGAQRIGRRSHDDGYALCRGLRSSDRSHAACHDNIDLCPQKIANQRGYRFDIIAKMAKLVGDVAPFDITEVAHPAHEFLAEWIVARGSRPDVPDTRHLPWLLRASRQRPGRSRAAEQRYELAALHLRGHSMTSSASESSLSGIWRRSAFAVLRLM